MTGIMASSPARGTWIEIVYPGGIVIGNTVVPRKGDVDRNSVAVSVGDHVTVVPRKGDVDRNVFTAPNTAKSETSSPARGTWIEILICMSSIWTGWVVPRKGDVDRNTERWVEKLVGRVVVPRKGDVDRNTTILF